MTPEQCECRAKGIPEGLYCGNPECPEVQEANRQLRSFYERILERQRARNLWCPNHPHPDRHIGPIVCEPVGGLKHWICLECYATVEQPTDGKARGRRPLSPVDVSPGVSRFSRTNRFNVE